MMADAIALAVAALVAFAYMLDLATTSEARQELIEISKERETERVADHHEWLDLPLDATEGLMSTRVIRLNEAWRRLGYALCPHPIARWLLPIGNPAR